MTAVAAVGRPDPHAGEVPVAFVTLVAGSPVTPDELEAWAADHVPERAAAPKHVEIIDEIPLTAIGKPYKPELRRQAAEQAARDAVAETGLADQVRAVLIDGAIEIRVPSSADDDQVRCGAFAVRLELEADEPRTRHKDKPMSTTTPQTSQSPRP